MSVKLGLRRLFPIYFVIIFLFVLSAIWGSKATTVMSENKPILGRTCIILDAGHGGEDGGAVSCTGVCESQINLEIALRLESLLHFLGYDTSMIRTTDRSVYTAGETIAARKVSDLKERVRIVNEAENALLVSIHQNYFTDGKYSGAQVFYNNHTQSRSLAEHIQSELVRHLNPGSNRKSKKADGIYVMEHVCCPSVLIECGFLSNPEEEAKLRNSEYQKALSCVIATALSQHIALDASAND